jgi:hypothetical protein
LWSVPNLTRFSEAFCPFPGRRLSAATNCRATIAKLVGFA